MRDQFLLDPGLVFLNHGSYGACPSPVLEAWQGWQRELERNPVEFLGRRSAALLRTARERAAAAFGAQADDLVFVPNATTGVATMARSWPLAPGDEVLGTDHEYGACEAAWQVACRERGAGYRRVEVPLPFDPDAFAGRVLAAADGRTRVIFVSHVTSTTALVFPLAGLVGGPGRRASSPWSTAPTCPANSISTSDPSAPTSTREPSTSGCARRRGRRSCGRAGRFSTGCTRWW